jgi:tRNA pseudouridine32 synthase/23S rRNA pseudouridine746 synthase
MPNNAPVENSAGPPVGHRLRLTPTYELIYHDEALLIANKPAGLLAVPGRGADKQDCLYSRILPQFPDALIVHRLDMATSGLMLFARGAAMQSVLSRLFRERKIVP